MADDLTLTVGGKSLKGWTEISVTRGVEICPNHFRLGLTERYPGEAQAAIVEAGAECTVKLGDDLVVTGYIDRVLTDTRATGHQVQVVGRGKCQDLVDCSAEYPSGQISGANALAIAQALVTPYGITALGKGDAGPSIPQFNLTLTDTPYSIIEEVCRFAALLCFEDAQGQLVLGPVGTDSAGGGLVEGENIQAATVVRSADDRFSEYDAFLLSMQMLNELGPMQPIGKAEDPGVKRHRLKAIIAEAASGDPDLVLKRARWEASRRAGRGQTAMIVADSWRDAGGALWAPNTRVSISLPSHKLDKVEWVVAEVVYDLNQRDGTTANLTLMPAEAFMPEPILLAPVIRGLE